MTLTRWSPGLAALEVDGLNRMFEAVFSNEPLTQGTWSPAVDIYEAADRAVVVKIELPNVSRDDIKITFENDVLTIEGDRKLEPLAEGGKYHRVERGYGSFRRTFTLPAHVDGGRIEAAYDQGVLTVTLPRREETKPRKIQIN